MTAFSSSGRLCHPERSEGSLSPQWVLHGTVGGTAARGYVQTGIHGSEDERVVEKNSAWRAEPLTWGHGPRVFEVFLEPTCPFSAKAFGKLDETLQSAGASNVTLKIWLHSQPWHLFSGVITRCT